MHTTSQASLLNRRLAFRHAGIAGVLVAGMAPAVHAQPLVRWRLASSFPKSLDTIFGGAEIFARHIKIVSGGKFGCGRCPAAAISCGCDECCF